MIPKTKTETWSLVGLALCLLLAASVRLAYNSVAVNATPIQADAANYVRYAENLVNHSVYSKGRHLSPVPDAYWAPGYPLFLAGILMVAQNLEINPDDTALNTQLVLGVLSVFLTWLLACRMMSRAWAIFPAFLLAVSPQVVAIGQNFLTETLFGFLLLLSIFLLVESMARQKFALVVLAGIAFALTWLVNPVSLFLAPVLALLLLLRATRRGDNRRKSLYVAAALLVPLVLLVASWSLRTSIVVPEGSPTSSGRLLTNLIIGMHSDYHETWRANKRNPDNPADLDERRIDGSYTRLFVIFSEYFSENPWEMARWYLFGKPRMLWSWNVQVGWRDIYVYPLRQSLYNVSAAAQASYKLMYLLHWPLVLAALSGMLFLLRSREGETQAALPVYLALLYVSAVYIATQSDPRYSFPLRAELYLCASFFLWKLARLVMNLAQPSPYDKGEG